jgi:hypothetical protein
MHIPDPFYGLSPLARKWLWVASLVISATFLLAMGRLDEALKTAAAPSGIISFQFAGDLAHAQRILSSWDAEAKVQAALSLGIDYLFLVAYALFISLACVHIAKALMVKWTVVATAGFFLAWGQFLAGLLDIIENYVLIQLLLGAQTKIYPSIAWGCAGIKFTLVGMGLAYMLVGYILHLRVNSD